jgi:aryl-phospho-beta-D-glucosidase BglC (GH1 family)
MPSPVLSVRGTQIVDASGTPVILRGYNIGGWMNMENFLTGYPGTESQHRRVLRQVLGPDLYEAFFDRFMTAFFTDADARYLASLGLNSVRIPFNYRHFEDDDRPFELKPEGFALLDRAIGHCQRHGLYAVLDFHALPGSQNQHWHSDNGTHVAGFWVHKHFQDRAIYLWEAIAARYRDNATVAGYNLMNEPADPEGTAIRPFCDRAIDAIRAVDPDHIIFLDGNRYATDFSAFEDVPVYPNVVYSAHDYALPGFVDGGPYPGLSRGTYVDRDVLEETFRRRTEFMRRTGTPIWIGEFGPVYTGDPERDEQKYQVLRDQLDIYRRHGAGWAVWAYKDVGLQGLVSAAPDSAWMKRIGDVLAKKARLGVDAWGTTDAGVRDIMAPIERAFAQEYPGFDPFPFGQENWIMTLVRCILLAEPMLEDFGRCFAGVAETATVHELADSFLLENCVVRQGLADVLAASARLLPPAGPGGAPARSRARSRPPATARSGRPAAGAAGCHRSARHARGGRLPPGSCGTRVPRAADATGPRAHGRPAGRCPTRPAARRSARR